MPGTTQPTPSLSAILQTPAQFCSAETASDLAVAAYRRAVALTRFGEPVVGIAATCGLTSGKPKRGDHRVWVAAHGERGTQLFGLKLAKGPRGRAGEDAIASQVVVMQRATTTLPSLWPTTDPGSWPFCCLHCVVPTELPGASRSMRWRTPVALTLLCCPSWSCCPLLTAVRSCR